MMSERKVRVRFAPSPTGPLHIGGVRTALYNYLFAKKHKGDFILRIEDTDQTRFVPGAEDYIIESLKWCGITPDEGQGVGGEFGPYKQSERKPMYRQFAENMVEAGYAYYAFDTSEELDAMRERLKQARVAAPQYNSTTRQTMKNSLTLSPEEVKQRLEAGDDYVIRIKMPRNEEVRLEDAIRGWVVVNTDNMDDKVLLKNDGMPTYHLANVVDDYHMNISHVIRGEEWLPSAPLHVLLYKYLGWEESTPTFAHLPLILKPDGNGKLSKRDGDRLGFPVFPLEWKDPQTGEISSGYRERDYIPEGFVNMLAFLGWNPGTEQEIFSLEELVEAFTLERVGKSGAKFDPDKTNWFNQQFLRMKDDAELGAVLSELLKAKGVEADMGKCVKAIPLLKERSTFYTDLLDGMYLFQAVESYDEKTVKKKWKEQTAGLIGEWKDVMSGMADFVAEEIEKEFKSFLEAKEIGMGQLLPAFRLALTGLGMGPSMFMIAEILGKEECAIRIEKAVAELG